MQNSGFVICGLRGPFSLPFLLSMKNIARQKNTTFVDQTKTSFLHMFGSWHPQFAHDIILQCMLMVM